MTDKTVEPSSGDFDLDILRTIDGREVEGIVTGAAMWEAAKCLKSKGLVKGFYRLSEDGRRRLRQLRASGNIP